jgi:membrane protease YdiL (CAAX protease family)
VSPVPDPPPAASPQASAPPLPEPGAPPLGDPLPALLAAALTLLAVTVVAALPLGDYAATAVGGCFLVATWWLVLRHDEITVRAHALSLGGLLEPPSAGGPSRLDLRRLARDALVAAGWAALFAAIAFPPFLLGYHGYWRPHGHFTLRFPPSLPSYVAGQIVVIALPEEAFFRGYLQTSLDRAWPRRLRFLGADVGVGLVVASAIFAVGHVLTIRHPARLAVFFPALLFGWLRNRTGGIGASVLFHASCNIFSETLGRSFGLIH